MILTGKEIRLAVSLVIMAFAFLETVLASQFPSIFQIELSLANAQWLLLICLSFWCAIILVAFWSSKNVPLIGLLLIALAIYFHQQDRWPISNITVLFTGVFLGKGIATLLADQFQTHNLKAN